MPNTRISDFNENINPNGSNIFPVIVNGQALKQTFSGLTTYVQNNITVTGVSTSDIFVTGGTYSNGTTIFRNNSGGTFSVSGYSTGGTSTVTGDTFVTGGTYSNGTAVFINNTGGTFSVSGFSTGGTSTVTGDTYVTGGTYSNGTAVFSNNSGNTFSVTGFTTGTTVDLILPSDFDWLTLSGVSSGLSIGINYNFNLSGLSITFPSRTSLKFTNSGKITNGVMTLNNTFVDANEYNIGILESLTISGTTLLNEVIRPEWFGSTVSNYNWNTALQTAINLAAYTATEVKLANRTYQYQSGITISAGVTFRGVSRGETAFSAGPTKGSILYCTGPTTGATITRAVEVNGRFVTMSDFTIKGESRFASKIDGLVLNGVGDGSNNAYLLESIQINNLLIHSCNRGLSLLAGNSGAVTYSNFDNIRVRDCQHHVKIQVQSANPIYANSGSTGLPFTIDSAFINSNVFSGLYSSGFSLSGMTIETQKQTNQVNSQDVYLPANNLQFNGVVFESPYAQGGHIRLVGGGSQVAMHDIRIEALQQDSHYPSSPVVYLGEGVNGCVIDMDQQSVSLVDLGYNNKFVSKGSKSANISPNSDNLYNNSSLFGLTTQDLTGTGGTKSYVIPEWTIEEQYVGTGSSYAWRTLRVDSPIKIAYTQNTRQPEFKALNFIVPPKYQLRMYQNVDRDTNLLTNAKISGFVNATALKDVQFTYQDAVTGILASSASFGDTIYTGNTYEPIGGWFPVTNSTIANYYRMALFCQNVQGENTGSTITFDFTQPSFVKGTEIKNTPDRYLTEKGGTVYGVMGYNLVENILPVTSASTYMNTVGSLELPLEGNYFEIAESGFYIQKINYTNNRFPRGTEIKLLFNTSGVTITDSAFINLTKPFISDVNSSITLYSKYGDGIWNEVNRFAKNESGYASYELKDITGTTANYLEIPLTGEKIINLTNTGNTTFNIQRINYINRFDADSRVLLQFNNTNGKVQISNSGYITLGLAGTYYPSDGDWLEMYSIGNGTWTELNRKTSALPTQSIGSTVFDISTVLSGVTGTSVNLPLTGENVFTIQNSGSTKTINRINDVTRFNAGSVITLNFSGITSAITITNGGQGGYINLSKTGDYVVGSNDWIELITTGNGTWTELKRKPSVNPEATIGNLSLELSGITSGTIVTLPRTGENIFTLNNTSLSAFTISRFNDASGLRFNSGNIIMVEFGTLTSGVTVTNSSYITLAKTGNWNPVANDWILLYTKGNGTWTELTRKQLAVPVATTGYQSLPYQTYVTTNFLIVPQTGENFFTIDGTTSGGTISRINNASGTRLNAGTQLTLEFANVSAHTITLSNSGYITLSGATNYAPTSGKMISFITKGDGTWTEMYRN